MTPDKVSSVSEAAERVLEWWPENSENGPAGQRMGDGFADDIRALREALRSSAPRTSEDAVKVPPLETYPWCKPREFLLLASYCGDDNDDCTKARPCADCLALCNIYGEDGKFIRELGNTLDCSVK